MENSLRKVKQQLNALNVDVSAALTNQYKHMQNFKSINKVTDNNSTVIVELREIMKDINTRIDGIEDQMNIMKNQIKELMGSTE